MNATIDVSKTQVSKTKATYEKVSDYIQSRLRARVVDVLDYGAGLCEGTPVLNKTNEVLAFSYEPFAKEGVTPNYRQPHEIFGLYDYVVNNCVLNVIADLNIRAEAVRNMLSHLKVGGQAIIMVRNWSTVKSNKTKVEYGDGYFMEASNTFQRGFTKKELLDFVAENSEGIRTAFSNVDMTFKFKPTSLGDIGLIVERVK